MVHEPLRRRALALAQHAALPHARAPRRGPPPAHPPPRGRPPEARDVPGQVHRHRAQARGASPFPPFSLPFRFFLSYPCPCHPPLPPCALACCRDGDPGAEPGGHSLTLTHLRCRSRTRSCACWTCGPSSRGRTPGRASRPSRNAAVAARTARCGRRGARAAMRCARRSATCAGRSGRCATPRPGTNTSTTRTCSTAGWTGTGTSAWASRAEGAALVRSGGLVAHRLRRLGRSGGRTVGGHWAPLPKGERADKARFGRGASRQASLARCAWIGSAPGACHSGLHSGRRRYLVVVAEFLVGQLFPVRLLAYSCSETGLWVPVSTLESRRIFEVFCITTFHDLTTSCSMLRYMTFHADV